jgi:putative PIN family toxin of toxin-antitoxin system
MTITMDTNVLFAALTSRRGASYAILTLVLNERITLALTSSIYFEYEAVLTRPSTLKLLTLTHEQITDVLDLLALLARKHEVYFLLRPNLRDETDNIFWECAFTSNSDYLVTANVRDFQDSALTGFPFAVVTPHEFFIRWRTQHG